MPAPPTFDARPLTDPVDRRAVDEFTRTMRAHKGRRTLSPNGLSLIMVAAAVAVLGVIIGAAVIKGATPWALTPVVAFALVYATVLVVIFFFHRRGRVARFRLSRFAATNGMTYEDHMRDPALPGLLFRLGRPRYADRMVRSHSPRFVEYGDYTFTQGTGLISGTHRWGYVAVKLDVSLPHIVLDSLDNNSMANTLPTPSATHQRLALGGDLGEHFALYCPQGVEQDARYLFTPEIVSGLLGVTTELDVEIVDDWLFLYCTRRVSTLDAAMWAWLFSNVTALTGRLDEWARWREAPIA